MHIAPTPHYQQVFLGYVIFFLVLESYIFCKTLPHVCSCRFLDYLCQPGVFCFF